MTKVYIKTPEATVNAADVSVPADRIFREAWIKPDQPVIDVDMAKARDIWRDKIRQVRTPALEGLDADFMKALESGADTSVIVSRKQALRDAPADPAIDAAATPEELKAVRPAGLNVL
ncbi:hypothetical protein [Aestuariispira ectoiniformans]|uniref:hypothetical protein n=1 Tax=Aestuariispira ectoiniformans TaxID=2775080 RepID=UPI00223A84F0|nr:hypothetical protein [Aestuariispira ectoiniformans]